MSALRPHHRTSLALGWEAARANLAPALCLQALMLALLLGYYFSPAVARLLESLAEYKMRRGLVFVLLAAVAAGALVPEIFLILFFQGGRPVRRNLRNLCFTIPIWALDGALVDLLYRSEAAWFGNVVTLPVVLAKICVDQLGYNPFFAAPFGRNLEYYTGFVFQIEADAALGPLQVAGGGRYDDLLSDIGSPVPVSAVGCAIGTEQLLAALGGRS